MATAKLLYRRLDALFGSLKKGRSQSKLIESFVEDALASLKDDLRLRAGLLYAERRDNFALVKTVGDTGSPIVEKLEPSSLRSPSWSGTASTSGHARGSGLAAAARRAAAGRRGGPDRGPAAAALRNPLPARGRLAARGAGLRAQHDARGARLAARRRARARQRSARRPRSSRACSSRSRPTSRATSIACRSVPAEEVGGDFYDFSTLGDDMLGLAIGDASGHGLPAALLVRDVVTGLRMGIEKELQGRARLREAEPRDPPQQPVEPLRVASSTASSSATATWST